VADLRRAQHAGRAVGVLPGQLGPAQRLAAAGVAAAEPDPAGADAAVPQPGHDLDVIRRRVGGWPPLVGDRVHPLEQLADGRAAHARVPEGVDDQPAVTDGGRDHVLHAELGLEPGLRAGKGHRADPAGRVGLASRHPHLDALHVGRAELVLGHQRQDRVGRPVPAVAAGVLLDRDSGVERLPRPVEAADARRVAVAAGEDRGEATRVERAVGCPELLAGEQAGQQSGAGGLAGVQRLGHRAEVEPQARRARRGDAQRGPGPRRVEAKQPGRRGGGPENPDGAGGVEAPRRVGETQAPSGPPGHLQPDQVGVYQLGAAGTGYLGRG
jgi:hypothetical protein